MNSMSAINLELLQPKIEELQLTHPTATGMSIRIEGDYVVVAFTTNDGVSEYRYGNEYIMEVQ